MKIAITGVTGFRNRGVEALTRPIIDCLRDTFANAEITVYSGSADYDQTRCCIPSVRFVPSGGIRPVPRGRRRLLNRLMLRATSDPYFGWDELHQADLLVVTGGDIFSSEYGGESLEHHLLPLRVAQHHNVPCVMLAQSIGPFTNQLHRDSWLSVARKCYSISVRETRTLRYLVDDLGLPEERIPLVADPAFLLKPDEHAVVWARTQAVSGRPLVAISVSNAICEWTGLPRDIWLAAWQEIVDKVLTVWQADVLLIPHVQETHADDRIACTEIWRKSEFSERISVMAADLSAAEYKGMISQCDMIIAERMHAGIAGLSTNVCTCIIAYSVKARGVLNDMLGETFVQNGALIEGATFDDVKRIWARLNSTWESRSLISAHLSKTVATAKIQAKMAFDYLPGILNRQTNERLLNDNA